MRRILPLIVIAATLAGCIPRAAPSPPPPAAAPAVRPPAPLPLPPAADWRDWPVTPGDWAYRQDARGSIALFGPTGGTALLVLRCDTARRQLYLSMPGGEATQITVRTTSAARSLALVPTGGDPPYVAVALAPGDPLLDAMGFSRGRFAVERPGAPPLAVPAWAEIERVTEDCRP